MKRWFLIMVLITLTLAVIANGTLTYSASAVVSQNGQLKVAGNKLCNASGQPVQLKGMSSMGLQYYPWTANTVKNLVDTWKVTIVRAAMYTAEKGYITDPATMKSRVKTIVDAAIANGIYVIIDWHILSDGNPNTYRDQSRAFFDEMSRTYGSYPNVIYEICNEPNGVDWNTIKTYADYVIPTIRANDPDNIIVCGTPTWSQDVDVAANSPLSYNNVMYALHFYSGTHTQWLRDKGNTAMSKGIALFVTEWGTSDATGGSNGQIYLAEAQNWINWMNANTISWCNWSLCPKAESSAALVPGASMDGPWSDSQLTESGKWVKSKILEGADNTPTPTIRVVTPTPTIRVVTPTPTRRAATPTPTRRGATPTPTRRAATPTPTTRFNTPTPTRGGSGNYVVAYVISSDWGTGATINVTITNNTTAAVNGWTLAFTFPGNQVITNLWNGTYTQSGAAVSVKDAGFNATIGANGGSVNFGFNCNYSGSNAKPTSFTLNGTACQVQ
ncbi:MAG: cellulase family glycosylhydrolase [Firmicutes bacterium]|nr:cellulase family glycosylhydrolase [Bacillota bacterium]